MLLACENLQFVAGTKKSHLRPSLGLPTIGILSGWALIRLARRLIQDSRRLLAAIAQLLVLLASRGETIGIIMLAHLYHNQWVTNTVGRTSGGSQCCIQDPQGPWR